MPDSEDREPAWIPAEQNTFKLRIVDCRPYTRTHLSATKDPAIAIRFTQSRALNGSQHRGKMPTNSSVLGCNLTYQSSGDLREGALFRAKVMEEKWDIDCFDDKLYFSRSWTGDLVYVAAVARGASTLTISSVSAKIDRESDSVISIRDCDFLVKTHLLGREVPHCLPTELPSVERLIFLYSFSQFGRTAAFATYEDTTGVGL